MDDSRKTNAQLVSELEDLRKKSEALEQECEFTSSILNTAHCIILVLDTEGRIVSYNVFMEDLSGYKLDEVKGKSWFDTFLPETDRDHIRVVFKETISGKDSSGTINPILTKDGSEVFIEWSPKPLKDNEGNITSLLSIGRNISEQRKNQRELMWRDGVLWIFTTVPDKKMYAEVLDVVLEAFQSAYGIFGFIDEKRNLVESSITSNLWDECQVEGKTIIYPPETWTGIWGKALTEQKSLYSNEPSIVPEGHLPIHCSMAAPILHKGETIGLLHVANKEGGYDDEDLRLLETIADRIGPMLQARLEAGRVENERRNILDALRKQSHELDERLKDLNCLYRISMIIEDDTLTLKDSLQGIVALLPPGWQYPEITCARITVGDIEVATDNFRKTKWMQTAKIKIKRKKAGTIEVAYLEEKPSCDEGAFLQEERKLIDEIALRIARMIEGHRAAETLRDNEAHYRNLFENIPIGVWLTAIDGRIIKINSALKKLTGYPDKEFLKKNAAELYFNPEDRARILAKLKEDKILRDHEVLLVRRDGSMFFASINMTPFMTREGETILTTVEDITGIKKAIEKVEHLNAVLLAIRNVNQLITQERNRDTLLQTACESLTKTRGYLSAWITTLDDSLKLVEAYQAGRPKIMEFASNRKGSGELLKCEHAALGCAGVYVIDDPEIYCADCPLRSAFPGEEDLVIKLESNGKIYGVLHASLPLALSRDPEEQRLFKELAQDISFALYSIELEAERQKEEDKRRDLEAQVQHVQKLESLGVLAGGIAHDFNNLLMGVLGHAELALMELPPESPALFNIGQVRTAALRLSELTNQMLAYSGKGRFLIESLNLNKIVDEMTHLIDVSLSKKAVIKYDLVDDLCHIKGDASQVRQVILNLITNASDAIGDRSGLITISTGVIEADRKYLDTTFLAEELEEGTYVHLEVSDTGKGMDKATMDKIFDPFFTTKVTGRGLGLAAVLGIVRGHKGAIKVYSEPNKGTTFKLLFPSATAEEEAIWKSEDHDAMKSLWRGTGTILVVDDEESVRNVAGIMLEKIGFKVLPALNGKEAVKLYKKHKDEVVLVLLDLTMPHMGGEEAFTELRRVNPHVKVLLCSGYNQQDTTSKFAGKGLAGFIQKPFGVKALTEKLAGILGEPENE